MPKGQPDAQDGSNPAPLAPVEAGFDETNRLVRALSMRNNGPMETSAAPALDPVAAATRLAPLAAEHAAETERNRRLPPDLVAAMANAGLFKLCVPACAGGLEAHPGLLVSSVEALATGDGAAGWCLAIGATSGLLGGYLPADSALAIYGPPATISGGVFAPKGRATIGDDGYRVSGRWPFASGCEHCDWLLGGSLVEVEGDVLKTASGAPEVRLMLAPASEVVIHDTWDVSGLRGTGSHDIEFVDLWIPAERSASVFSDPPLQTGPLYAFPLFGLLAIAIAGVSLGIARGALDDLVELAAGKTPTGSTRALASRSTVQAEGARAEATLRAARALLMESVETAWADAVRDGEVSLENRMGLRLAATHATDSSARVTESAYRLGGGSVIYQRSPLQRRFRDVQVATQHMIVAPATLELSGRILFGLPTDSAQL